jgi:hypothetical protein
MDPKYSKEGTQPSPCSCPCPHCQHQHCHPPGPDTHQPPPLKVFELDKVDVTVLLQMLTDALGQGQYKLLQAVLESIPHPEVHHRKVWSDVLDVTPHKTWKKMQLVRLPCALLICWERNAKLFSDLPR